MKHAGDQEPRRARFRAVHSSLGPRRVRWGWLGSGVPVWPRGEMTFTREIESRLGAQYREGEKYIHTLSDELGAEWAVSIPTRGSPRATVVSRGIGLTPVQSTGKNCGSVPRVPSTARVSLRFFALQRGQRRPQRERAWPRSIPRSLPPGRPSNSGHNPGNPSPRWGVLQSPASPGGANQHERTIVPSSVSPRPTLPTHRTQTRPGRRMPSCDKPVDVYQTG